jgi:hypothetical protein
MKLTVLILLFFSVFFFASEGVDFAIEKKFFP